MSASNPLKRLTELGQSVWYDYIRRDLITSGRAGEADPRGRPGGDDVEPDDLPERDREDRSLRRGRPERRERGKGALRHLREARGGRRVARGGRLPSRLRRGRRERRVRLDRGGTEARERHGRLDPRGAPALGGLQPAERHGQDPRDRGGSPGDPPVPGGGDQHQHHAPLLGLPAPGGDGGLPLRARGAGRGRPADRLAAVGRQLLRQPRGHERGQEARPRSAADAARAPPRKGSPSPTRSWPTRPSARSSGRRASWPSKAKGASLQRPLWASTSTKDPAYPDLYYVEALVAPDTVDTMPPETFDAYRDHGDPKVRISDDMEAARAVFPRLAELGIDGGGRLARARGGGRPEVLGLLRLAAQGAGRKRKGHEGRLKLAAGPFRDANQNALRRLQSERAVSRIWSGDASLWKKDEAHRRTIENALGWLTIAERMTAQLPALGELARTDALRYGPGPRPRDGRLVPGSARLRLLLRPAARAIPGSRSSTRPSLPACSRRPKAAPPGRTVYVVSSKSGTTLEPNLFFDYFYALAEQALGSKAGERFVVVTDPGTPLQEVARSRNVEVDRSRGPRDRRPLLGAVAVRHRSRGARRRGRPRPARRRAEDGGLLPRGAGGREPGRLARRGDGSARPRGARQADVLGGIAGGPLRDVGRAADRGVDRQGGEGDPAGRGRAARAARALRGRSVLRSNRAGRGRRRAASSRRSRARATPSRGLRLPIRSRSAPKCSAGSSRPPWPDRSSGSTRSTSRTSRRPRTARTRSSPERKRASGGSAGGPASPGELVASLRPRDYFAITAYLPSTPENEERLARLRLPVRDGKRVATTVGFGPRFLHSTGQFHKGGPDTGVFLQLTAAPAASVPIPGRPYGFERVVAAQAAGDLAALLSRGRRATTVRLAGDPAQQLEALAAELSRSAGAS